MPLLNPVSIQPIYFKKFLGSIHHSKSFWIHLTKPLLAGVDYCNSIVAIFPAAPFDHRQRVEECRMMSPEIMKTEQLSMK